MLSGKIVMTGLYQCEPKEEWLPKSHRDMPYWARNWTFVPREYSGVLYMYDTYFNESCIEVTDENIDCFSLVFDFAEVREIRKSEADEYEEVYRVATDSGGWGHPHYFVKNDAEKSTAKRMEKLNGEIERLKFALELKERELERLKGEK